MIIYVTLLYIYFINILKNEVKHDPDPRQPGTGGVGIVGLSHGVSLT